MNRKTLTRIVADYLYNGDEQAFLALEAVDWERLNKGDPETEIIYEFVDDRFVIVLPGNRYAPLLARDVSDAWTLFCVEGIAVWFTDWSIGHGQGQLLLVPVSDEKTEVLYDGVMREYIDNLVSSIRPYVEVETYASTGDFDREFLARRYVERFGKG